MTAPPQRPEADILADLTQLCSQPGYIHAFAFLSMEAVIHYSGELTTEDLAAIYTPDRLIRTETTTLLGLLIKADINQDLPAPDVVQSYIDQSKHLLQELHDSMAGMAFQEIFTNPPNRSDDPFCRGAVLKESIFYGGESAYDFQYRDLAVQRYSQDAAWLSANYGFTIDDARTVTVAAADLVNERLNSVVRQLRTATPDTWTVLPGFTFTAADIVARTGLSAATVSSVLKGFSLPEAERNGEFVRLSDFNAVTAYPLIPLCSGTYALFSIYSLSQALYDAPFYWLHRDAAYRSIAMEHRGRFAEELAAACLRRVFGPSNVHTNVEIHDRRGGITAEIDVLVLFANRALVVQVKSKKLTLEARSGHDGRIKDDFAKGVQAAYDQAAICQRLLSSNEHKLVSRDSREVIALAAPLESAHILCVVSDHYPALSAQARAFLNTADGAGGPPFVLDVFTLDVMTEMLSTPLYLLSYVERRASYSHKIIAGHELIVLAYHLSKNLWLSAGVDLLALQDDVAVGLDRAMLVRRAAIDGPKSPEGILTRVQGTTVGALIRQIEADPDATLLKLGLLLLTLSEDAVLDVSRGVDIVVSRARTDGITHDVTVRLKDADSGLTVHVSSDPGARALRRLERHCRIRKYAGRARTWFGICIRPDDHEIRFGVELDYPWQGDKGAASRAAVLGPTRRKPKGVMRPQRSGSRKRDRNATCPCGSGRRYKKCCLYR
jgi:hypothetical protein